MIIRSKRGSFCKFCFIFFELFEQLIPVPPRNIKKGRREHFAPKYRALIEALEKKKLFREQLLARAMKPARDTRRHRALTTPVSSLAHAIHVSLGRPDLIADPASRGLDSIKLHEFLSNFLFPDHQGNSDHHHGAVVFDERCGEGEIAASSSSSEHEKRKDAASSSNEEGPRNENGDAGEDRSSPSSQTGSNLARWQLADAARAKIQNKNIHATTATTPAANQNGSHVSPSSVVADCSNSNNRYVTAQDNDQLQFFSRKYTEAIDRLDRLVAEHQREKDKWEVERNLLTARAFDAESKLQNVENQLRFMQDRTKMDIERCTNAEVAVHEIRREKESIRDRLEKLQSFMEGKRIDEVNLLRRNKDLQGQLDHLQGKSTVPFPSLQALEEIQSKNKLLDEENTKLKNDLGRRAMEFSTKLKETARERDAALQEAAVLKARVAELQLQAQTASGGGDDGSGGSSSAPSVAADHRP